MRIATYVRLCASLAMFLAANAARAQTPGERPQMPPAMSRALAAATEGPPLRLEDAIRQALENNADLTAARKQVEPLRTRPAQVRFLAPPMLEAQIWQWPINTLNPANTNMYMLMASQELPGRGKRDALKTLAESEIRVADVTVSTRERDIVAAVSEAYWDLSIARRAIAIHLASVDLLHQLTDVAQAKYAAGRISQTDVLKAVVEATKLHDDLIGFERQSDQARVRLNALLNRQLDAPIGVLAEPTEAVLTLSVTDLEVLAMREHPELRVARAQIGRAQAQQAVARSTGTPDWSVGAGYMLQPRQTDAWLARVSVTWPRAPWSRGAIDARIAEAAAALSADEAEAAALETRVRLSVAEAYFRIKAAEERAALLRTALLPQSRQALDVSRIAYQTDRIDFLAVIENERTLLDAQLAFDRVLTDWRHALADLERAIGTTLQATATTPRIALNEVKR